MLLLRQQVLVCLECIFLLYLREKFSQVYCISDTDTRYRSQNVSRCKIQDTLLYLKYVSRYVYFRYCPALLRLVRNLQTTALS